MKIVHIISNLGNGGAEKMLFRIAKNLRGHEHIIVSLTSNGPIGRQLIQDGFAVHVFNIRHVFAPLSLIKLWLLLRKVRPDIVQTWMYHADLIGSVVSRLAGITNILWNVRGTKIPQSGWSVTGVFISICAMLSSWLPKKIICCAQSALEAHSTLGYSSNRMIVIPNGYEINNFEPYPGGRHAARRFLGLPIDAKIIGMVGRYDLLKGFDTFLKAADLLSEKYGDKLIFILAGKNVNASNKDLIDLMFGCASNSTIRLLDERDDIPMVMQALDVYCLASIAEGFPNVVAEAMLMEVPCVVTDVGDARRIVGDEGIVVPPNDPNALANAVQELLTLPGDKRANLGRAARQRIVNNYSIEAIVAKYRILYSAIGSA